MIGLIWLLLVAAVVAGIGSFFLGAIAWIARVVAFVLIVIFIVSWFRG